MGTKSHISKALPASIMTKGIGLILLHQATFRAGCVYLNFHGHFLYVFQHEKRRFGCSQLPYSVLFCSILYRKPWSVNLVFLFGKKNPSAMEVLELCSLLTVCLAVLSFSHTLSVFFSPSLSLTVSEHL